MSNYTAMPTATYALVRDAVEFRYQGQEWPEELVALHLRYLVGEYKRGELGPGRRQRWPTSRELAALVGWRFDRVARFVAREAAFVVDDREVSFPHWMDPYQLLPLVDLTGDRRVGANRNPTAARRQPDGSPTVETEQAAQSGSESDGSPTAARRQPDAVRDTSARVPSTRYPDPDRGVPRAREVDPVTTVPTATAPATPRPTASEVVQNPNHLRDEPPVDPAEPDLVAYLGLELQAHAVALVRAGITTRTALLALTPEDLRFTPGLGGARAKAVAARVTRQGDRLAPDTPKPNGRAPPGGRGPPGNPPPPSPVHARPNPFGEPDAPAPDPSAARRGDLAGTQPLARPG